MNSNSDNPSAPLAGLPPQGSHPFDPVADMEQLRRSQQEWEHIFHAIGQPSLILAPDHSIIAANKAVLELTGKTLEQLRGCKCHEVFHQMPCAPAQCPLQTLMREGHVETTEMMVEAANKVFLVSCTPVFDPQGKIEKIIHIATDITHRKRIEEAHRETTYMLQKVLDTIPVRVFWKDTSLRYLGCNSAFARDAGQHSPDQITGRNDFELAWAANAEAYRSDDREVLESGVPKIKYEEPQTTPTGKTIILRTSKVPLLDAEGRVRGVLGTYEDISDQKRMETELRQAQKMETIGTLAGGVAHDFNNILSIILLNLDMLKSAGPMTKDQGEALEVINEAAQRAANLTRQLLAFSRKQSLRRHRLDLNDIVGDLNRLIKRVIGEDIELECVLASDPQPVMVDRGMIEQVLLNIVVNARDAMPRGGRLRIRVQRLRPMTGVPHSQNHPSAQVVEHVCVEITDTGVGIAPEILPRLFDPFFTTKDVGQGTGLGLATAYGIIEQHRGWIEVHSRVGEGATFRVFLPLDATDTEIPAADTSAVVGGDEIILFVEDEPAVRLMAGRCLRRMGYTVVEAADGPEALRIVQASSRPFHLLLTDVIMPGNMNGRELADNLRAAQPSLKVLFTSGYSAEATQGIKLLEGVNYLPKPFNPATLARTVRRCLDT
jgi:PAS domain S-box-containing protein